MEKKGDKFSLALDDLELAISIYEQHIESPKEERIYFMLLVKCFEVLVEYAWKKLKAYLDEQGVEALTPKEIFKTSASINLLKNPKFWIDAINARNLSVHDYYSIPNAKYYELAKKCLLEAKEIKKIRVGGDS